MSRLQRSNKTILLSKRQGCLLLLCLALFPACDWLLPKTLPSFITGEWRTDDSRYRGRFIKLETERVTFGLNGLAPDRSERIDRVKMSPRDNPTDFAIRLTDDSGMRDSLLLEFDPDNRELRLKNQPNVVWRRKGDLLESPPLPSSPPSFSPQPSSSLPSKKSNRRVHTIPGEHRTIYKIDCLRPDECISY